jgi:ribosomal protein S12 methylthiotransferase accessory factor
MMKVYRKGTHRSRHPEETLALVMPLLPAFGVTRLADVTGLDTLGIPVVMAVRPTAATLSVSQGKGLDPVSARVSAAMEAIELWHAEFAVPSPEIVRAPAKCLSLPYTVSDLDNSAESLATEHTCLDWVRAVGLVSGTLTPVPHGFVEMGWSTNPWPPPLVVSTSNGLASGNSFFEALTHGLYEVIERDAVSSIARTPVSKRSYLRAESVDDQHCREIIDRLNHAGAWFEIVSAPTKVGVACFSCYLWTPDFSAPMACGSGAHSDPSVALSRALTEAAQSRLTYISGTRDDISPRAFGFASHVRPNSISAAPHIVWSGCIHNARKTFDTFEAESSWLAQKIGQVTGIEPLAIDLSTDDRFAVVKVLCPGLDFSARHEIPRDDGE